MIEDFMKTIVITTPGTILSVDQTHFTLRTKGKKIGRIPPVMMGHVVVGAQVEVSRKALERLDHNSPRSTLSTVH